MTSPFVRARITVLPPFGQFGEEDGANALTLCVRHVFK